MSRLHICVEWHDGFWYGKAYIADNRGNELEIVHRTYAFSDKRDAQQEIIEWWNEHLPKPEE